MKKRMSAFLLIVIVLVAVVVFFSFSTNDNEISSSNVGRLNSNKININFDFGESISCDDLQLMECNGREGCEVIWVGIEAYEGNINSYDNVFDGSVSISGDDGLLERPLDLTYRVTDLDELSVYDGESYCVKYVYGAS